MDVPVARRVSRPRWVNARTVLGLVLFAAAVLLGRHVLAESDRTIHVWAAAKALAPGERIEEEDVVPLPVVLPESAGPRYIVGPPPVGSVVTRALGAGEMIPAASVSSGAEARLGQVISVPVPEENAAGGRLGPGDRVDVYASFDSGTPAARTVLLAGDVRVLDVVRSSGVVLDDQSAVGVTLSVAPPQAGSIAFAIHNADIDLVQIVSRSGEQGTTFGPGDL